MANLNQLITLEVESRYQVKINWQFNQDNTMFWFYKFQNKQNRLLLTQFNLKENW